MGVDEFFNLRRAEEERLRAARARSLTAKRAHMELAAQFHRKALLVKQ
jgi:hypothetical protein